MAETQAVPGGHRLAWGLGLAGALPFLAAALAAALAMPGAATVLIAYGAVILSFLGGIHWGLAAAGRPPAAARLVIGVVPSLVAWLALLLPADAGLAVLVAAFPLQYGADRRLDTPVGLLPLRLTLTLLVTAALLAALVARLAGGA